MKVVRLSHSFKLDLRSKWVAHVQVADKWPVWRGTAAWLYEMTDMPKTIRKMIAKFGL